MLKCESHPRVDVTVSEDLFFRVKKKIRELISFFFFLNFYLFCFIFNLAVFFFFFFFFFFFLFFWFLIVCLSNLTFLFQIYSVFEPLSLE